jgi:hypothetical protein
MEDYENSEGFMLPKSFLTQLAEYTRGYMLLVCNEKGELFAHESYDNAVIKLGIVNFAEMHANAIQKHLKNVALKEEQESEIEVELDITDDEDDEDDDEDDDEQYETEN